MFTGLTRIFGSYLKIKITVFIPTLPNHGSIYANSINGIIANPFQTYTEQCPNGTAGYFSLNYLALQIQQPISKLGITKFQDFIWPTKQINRSIVKLALIGKKDSDSQLQNWLLDTVRQLIIFFPFILLYPLSRKQLISKRCSVSILCFLESNLSKQALAQSFTRCNKLFFN